MCLENCFFSQVSFLCLLHVGSDVDIVGFSCCYVFLSEIAGPAKVSEYKFNKHFSPFFWQVFINRLFSRRRQVILYKLGSI